MVAVVEEKSARGYREIALLVFSVCALFLLIALLTFSLDDPGWSHSASYRAVNNACGLLGAWLADVMLSFLGLMAYLIPPMIFWLGYSVYAPDKTQSSGWMLTVRGCGFLLTLLAGAAIFFLHLHFLRTKVDLPESPGGILGREIGELLVHLVGNSGSTLLLLAAFMTGLTLLTGLSWLELMNMIGKASMGLFSILGRQSL
ncbi:MAG: cell division protein FtsK, partial [Methylomonas sp.]